MTLTHFSLTFQLLDCFSIPVILLLSWIVLGARYRLSHIGGMALALASVILLVWMDVDDGKGGVSAGGEALSHIFAWVTKISLNAV